jgi:pre-rRNA-processing protein IPI1
LTKHHSSQTQKEALLYLQQHAGEHVSNLRPLFSAVAPLILDQSKIVRDSTLELFKSPDIMDNLQYHIDFVILYIHSAMTHITPEIRSQSTQFLDVLIDAAPKIVCRTAWAKTLSCFFPLLGWSLDISESKQGMKGPSLASSTVSAGLSLGANSTKARLGHLQSLNKLVTVGTDTALDENNSGILFHPDTSKFLMTSTSTNPFASLSLFGTALSTSSSPSVTEDSTSRLDLIRVYWRSLLLGLQDSIKESGQIGRTAKSLLVFLEQRLS